MDNNPIWIDLTITKSNQVGDFKQRFSEWRQRLIEHAMTVPADAPNDEVANVAVALVGDDVIDEWSEVIIEKATATENHIRILEVAPFDINDVNTIPILEP